MIKKSVFEIDFQRIWTNDSIKLTVKCILVLVEVKLKAHVIRNGKPK